ncbi:unnamed protein product [Clavelina lepadiformis]|uniref:Uncharacterized protein n=1 Tax=Clavelina lepadiformis TaxID=159417 RepID=A0ABP0G0P4_CLALP
MTKMLTTPGIPRQSPIQVLTGPEVAKLPRSNEISMTKILTKPGIPRRSPIQVLTGSEVV